MNGLQCLLSNCKNVFLYFQICIDGQTKLSLAVHCELSNLARPTMGNSNIRSEGIFLLFSHCYSQEKERKKGKDRTELAERKQLHIDIADFFQLTSSNEPSHLFFQSFCHKIKSINLFIGTESTIHATLLPSKSKIFDKKKNQRENLALQLTEMIGCKTSIKADVLVRNYSSVPFQGCYCQATYLIKIDFCAWKLRSCNHPMKVIRNLTQKI